MAKVIIKILQGSAVTQTMLDGLYTVSQKRDPDVIDCNFEKD